MYPPEWPLESKGEHAMVDLEAVRCRDPLWSWGAQLGNWPKPSKKLETVNSSLLTSIDLKYCHYRNNNDLPACMYASMVVCMCVVPHGMAVARSLWWHPPDEFTRTRMFIGSLCGWWRGTAYGRCSALVPVVHLVHHDLIFYRIFSSPARSHFRHSGDMNIVGT